MHDGALRSDLNAMSMGFAVDKIAAIDTLFSMLIEPGILSIAMVDPLIPFADIFHVGGWIPVGSIPLSLIGRKGSLINGARAGPGIRALSMS